jgi:hypothetical protein
MPDAPSQDEQFMAALTAVLQYVEDVAKGRIRDDARLHSRSLAHRRSV